MMIKRSDWEAVHRELLAAERGKLGPLPSEEELLAFSQGELPPERAESIREVLVCYPHVARALVEPFPSPAAARLSREEMASDWVKLMARIAKAGEKAPAAAGERAVPPGLQDAYPEGRRGLGPLLAAVRALFSPAWRLAWAATFVAIVFAGLFVRAQSHLVRQEQELGQPRVNPEKRVLLADGQRGGGAEQPPIQLPAAADSFLLRPALVHAPKFPDYRLDIEDLTSNPPQQVWSAAGLRRLPDDTFEVWVPRAFLRSAEYRLVLYGLGAGPPQRLATYSIELSRD